MCRTLIPLLVFVFSLAAFAHEREPGARVLSFKEFKDSCLNPMQFQSQRPPQDIKVVCKDVRRTWVPVDSGSIRMVSPRVITSEVYSDKFHVALAEHHPVNEESMVACSRFKEVAQVVSTERAVTCDEILALKGELHDFCADVTSQLVASNAGSAQISDTGRVYDTCPRKAVKQCHHRRLLGRDCDPEDE